MTMKHIPHFSIALFFVIAICLSGCQTNTPPVASAEKETTGSKSLAPKRVDIRGNILRSRYQDGQVILEIEGRIPTPDSRYDRAFVLVLPTTQIVGLDGRSLNMNELIQGQNVAILLRGGGQGNSEGIGVARKMWIEPYY